MSILYSENWHFLTLPYISLQPMMVERQTIPHMNEQFSSFFRGCQATSFLECVFFTRKVAWSSLIELHSCSWHILTPTSRTKKWGIICLRSSIGSRLSTIKQKVEMGVWSITIQSVSGRTFSASGHCLLYYQQISFLSLVTYFAPEFTLQSKIKEQTRMNK